MTSCSRLLRILGWAQQNIKPSRGPFLVCVIFHEAGPEEMEQRRCRLEGGDDVFPFGHVDFEVPVGCPSGEFPVGSWI